jgi:hypothetical protein
MTVIISRCTLVENTRKTKRKERERERGDGQVFIDEPNKLSIMVDHKFMGVIIVDQWWRRSKGKGWRRETALETYRRAHHNNNTNTNTKQKANRKKQQRETTQEQGD